MSKIEPEPIDLRISPTEARGFIPLSEEERKAMEETRKNLDPKDDPAEFQTFSITFEETTEI